MNTTSRATPPARLPAADGQAAPNETETPRIDRGLGMERLVFFSDAVFAIAITLLVVELHLPALVEPTTDAAVQAAIGSLGAGLFAYVLSFLTIGSYWLAHWRRFRWIVAVDGPLTVLNLLLLGFIAFLPFPTAVLGEHGDLPTPVVFYALMQACAGLAGPASWLYAWRAGLVRPGVTRRFVLGAAFRGFSVPIVMLASLPLLPVLGPTGVEVSWVAIIPVQLLFNRLFARGH